jgi:hypothetical protein
MEAKMKFAGIAMWRENPSTIPTSMVIDFVGYM